MSSAKNKKRWLVALVAATTMSGGVAFAASPEPLQCLGRFVGAGWGDGYHACETSGFRPTANLPPKSYYQQFERSNGQGRSNCSPGNACASAIKTLYGSATQACDDSGCDTPMCDGSGCDEFGCDIAPMFESLNGSATYPTDQSTLGNESPQRAPHETTVIEQPVPQPESVSTAPDHSQSVIEELPAPEPKAKKPKVKKPTVELPAPKSPSDASSILESSAVAPSHNSLAIDLHESQMRPIRPLPPEPKRELTQPVRPQSTLDSSESRVPVKLPNPVAPRGLHLPTPYEASERTNTTHLNQASIQTNPFVVSTENAASLAQRPTRLGGATRKSIESEAKHRVAEVPERFFVKQPR